MNCQASAVLVAVCLLIGSSLAGCGQSSPVSPPPAVVATPQEAPQSEQLKSAMQFVDEFRTPGLECELSGIYPHPTDPDCYYVMANNKPPYRYGQKPLLPVEHRGKLLTVNRQGEVIASLAITEDDFGGLEYVDGHFYVALTNAAEIRKIDPASGKTVKRFPLSSPAGGLGYDPDRNVLIAQLYVGHPHLAVLNIQTGETLETLWSDESAMGLAKVDGDWLCTWAGGWEAGSVSEMRVLDQRTGKVRSRTVLDRIHSCMAPATTNTGEPGFMCLVTVDSKSGQTVIRKYRYSGERNWKNS